MYFPSGEYLGLPSKAGLEAVMSLAVGWTPASGTVHRSLFVEEAGVLSRLDAKTNSLLSGAKSYCKGPPTWNAGESKSPDVKSRTAPVETSANRMWVRFPSFHSVQWR